MIDGGRWGECREEGGEKREQTFQKTNESLERNRTVAAESGEEEAQKEASNNNF